MSEMIYNPPLESIELTNLIGLDTEFNSLDILNADLLAISICNQNETTYVLDVSKYTKEDLKVFFSRVESSTVICHNTKVDIGIIYAYTGILLRNIYCTMLASRIIDNGYMLSENMVGCIPGIDSAHSLIGVCKRYLRLDLMDTGDKKILQGSFINHSVGEPLSEAQLKYAGNDAIYLIPIHKIQQEFIYERNVQEIIKLENKLTPVLIKIEFKGCLIDVNQHYENIDKWKTILWNIKLELDNYVKNLAKEHETLRGGVFTNQRIKQQITQLGLFGDNVVVENDNLHNLNYSSTKDIEKIFTWLDLPKPMDDEGKISFGENPIKTYITNHPDSILKEFLLKLLDHREYEKLLSTYGENILKVIDKNNRLRTNYGQCWTDTGRLTSSAVIKNKLGVNLANIPKNSDARRIFIPDEGYSFIDSDMTGQEVALAGDFSKEPVLLKAFKEGFDHHSFLASISFSIVFREQIEIKNKDEYFEVDGFKYNYKKLRDVHKSCLFAKFYGGGKNRVMNVLNEYLVNHIAPAERLLVADQISKALDKALPVLTRYLKNKVTFTKEHGYLVANKLGRRRYFDNPDKSYGEIMNFPIQGSGADAIKIALYKIDKWLGEKSKELGIAEEELGWITMTIYDQNLCCLNDKYLHLAPQIQEMMGKSLGYFLTELEGASDLNIRKYWSK